MCLSDVKSMRHCSRGRGERHRAESRLLVQLRRHLAASEMTTHTTGPPCAEVTLDNDGTETIENACNVEMGEGGYMVPRLELGEVSSQPPR